jgi:hypothetical protein
MERAANDQANLLRDLEVVVINLQEEFFSPNYAPRHLCKGAELNEGQQVVKKLWRIRRFLREQRGMPVANLAHLPQEASASRSASEYDPEYDPLNPADKYGLGDIVHQSQDDGEAPN